jgi:hypothetical protein
MQQIIQAFVSALPGGGIGAAIGGAVGWQLAAPSNQGNDVVLAASLQRPYVALGAFFGALIGAGVWAAAVAIKKRSS